jgi:Chain length determinant protein
VFALKGFCTHRHTAPVPVTTPTTPPHDLPAYDPPPAPPKRPPVGLFAAGLRYWPVVLLAVIAFGGAAAAYAFNRPPKYTAEARIAAMNLQVENIAALPGVLDASRAVTTLYSRAVVADDVTGPVAERLKLSRGFVASHVSATPMSDAPVIRVQATSPSGAQAINLANATSDSLLAFVKTRTGASFKTADVLRRYRSHQVTAARLRDKRDSAEQDLQEADSDSNRRQLADASADLAQENLRLDTIKTEYQNALLAQRAAPSAQKLSSASGARTDRSSTVQVAVFLGVLAGLVVGLAFAGLLAARRRRRLSFG